MSVLSRLKAFYIPNRQPRILSESRPTPSDFGPDLWLFGTYQLRWLGTFAAIALVAWTIKGF